MIKKIKVVSNTGVTELTQFDGTFTGNELFKNVKNACEHLHLPMPESWEGLKMIGSKEDNRYISIEDVKTNESKTKKAVKKDS